MCRKCAQQAWFSAQDQQFAFEVRKEHICRRRTLCQTCWQQAQAIKAELRIMETLYCEQKAAKLADPIFLQDWLTLLKDYIPYHWRHNTGRIRFLEKQLALLANNNAVPTGSEQEPKA